MSREIIPPAVRAEVAERDDFSCVCERANFPPEVIEACYRAGTSHVHFDHVRGSGALQRKSRSTPDNLVLLSPSAHRWKTDNGATARPLLLKYLAKFYEGETA